MGASLASALGNMALPGATGLGTAAAFPIKKFNKVVCVLVLYSNKTDFFDEEIEILFDKMMSFFRFVSCIVVSDLSP